MTHHRRFPACLCTALIAALGTPMLSAEAQQTLRLTPANGRVAIWNLVGMARIERGTSSEVEVQITPQGADAERMITRTGLIDGEQTLRIFYPADEIRPAGRTRRNGNSWYSTLRLREDGRFDGRNNTGRRMRIGSGADFEAAADLVIRVPQDVTLDLHVAVGDVEAVGTTHDLTIDTHSGRVQTSNTRGPLHIDTGSGSVEIIGHTGDLDADTGSGSIEASDITGARVISLDTGSGSIVANNCRASESLRMDTGSGRIVASRIEAPDMTLDTGSGSVEVSPTAKAGALHVDTGSGSVTLFAPADFGAQLDISAGSGGISSDLPLQAMRRSEGELSGRIGDGRSRVSIETGSGGVAIRSRSQRL